MTTEQYCVALGLVLTNEQWLAFRYLESWGFRFCVDFGYDNAIERADHHQWLQLQRSGVS